MGWKKKASKVGKKVVKIGKKVSAAAEIVVPVITAISSQQSEKSDHSQSAR